MSEEEYLEEGTEEGENAGFSVRVFFHTGAAGSVAVTEDTNLVDLRKILEEDEGRRTYGSVILYNGVAVEPEAEEEVTLSPGDIITFSGTVKGG